MTIQEMIERKKELGYSYAQIAELSGVPLSTVQKIFSGTTTSPRYETLRALARVLGRPEGHSSSVCETQSPYSAKEQGEYTLEDYYRLPEEQRAELIDGVIYDMTSPTAAHQLITGAIFAKLLSHVATKGGTCVPIVSPMDVQLDCDDRTMVEPDVIVVCDREKIINRCIYGAPDFLVEVLSKSTRKKDMVTKLNKYMLAGVREYWIIDPDKKIVLVYDFESDNYPAIYGFDASIPVAIWDRELEIDFQEIYDQIRFLYEKP